MNTKQLIQKWMQAQQKLTHWKQTESDLRDQVVHKLFKDAPSGTTKKETILGELTCTITNIYAVDSAALSKLRLPSKMKKALIKTRHSLIQKGYKELSQEQRDQFDTCLTVKPGKPQLKLEQCND